MTTPTSRVENWVARLLAAGAQPLLAGNRIGLEKEGLRVAPSGSIAMTPHPPALGAPLTHPAITTDFSEALLELITPALHGPEAVLDYLADLHTYVYEQLGDELLWATSMPCVLAGGGNIPLAEYGTSNAARMKTAYRRGLGNRYGRTMQVIAGIHFNFSFAAPFIELWRQLRAPERAPEAFHAEAHMGMIRNLQRIGWLVPYLFGCSPAVCASFVAGRDTDLEHFDATTLYYPHATSLRMGDIGYQNQQEQGTGMKASYDSLDAYIRSLTWAIETPCPQYEAIGVKVGERYEQLNANVLQIENEYYSTVRPKQLTRWLERPTLALRRRGIAYVELRSPDIDLFEPVGIGLDTMRFLETLMLYCLLSESPRINAAERRSIDDNQVTTAHRGRQPGLTLIRERAPIALREWADEVLDAMAGVAELLDGGAHGAHGVSLEQQRAKVADPEATPSAVLLATMRARGEGFFPVARALSETHREAFGRRLLPPERRAEFVRLGAESLARRAAIEAADNIDFDRFLRDYFAPGNQEA